MAIDINWDDDCYMMKEGQSKQMAQVWTDEFFFDIKYPLIVYLLTGFFKEITIYF